MYTDSHAHLDSSQFAVDRDAVLLRAHEVGVSRILTIGNGDGPATMDCALKIAAEVAQKREAGEPLPRVFASAGIHPHDAKLLDDPARATMRSLAADLNIIAWGEIGLDYHYNHSPREVQQQAFNEQLQLAAEFDLPIIIHCRPTDGSSDAFDDLFRLLQQHWQGRRGILHCFTGGVAEARTALDLGFILSFAGNVSFPKMPQIREAAAFVPRDRFLVETDCPYLSPVPLRGKRNEPAFVVQTAAHVGGLRGISGEEAGEQATANFLSFFQSYRRIQAICPEGF
ncbi:MAG: TatD family hydrolase [Acidobacteriaceae bacterium]